MFWVLKRTVSLVYEYKHFILTPKMIMYIDIWLRVRNRKIIILFLNQSK